MNQTRWQNGQTVADILDLLMYSSARDGEMLQHQTQDGDSANQANADEARPTKFAVEGSEQSGNRAAKRRRSST